MHWRRKWQPTPVFLPGESQGQRSLEGCHLWVAQSQIQLKRLSSSSSSRATSLSLFTFMHWRRKWQPTPVFLPGKSQGQRSLVGCCLGDAQSRTRLKQLSSSSSSSSTERFSRRSLKATLFTLCSDRLSLSVHLQNLLGLFKLSICAKVFPFLFLHQAYSYSFINPSQM